MLPSRLLLLAAFLLCGGCVASKQDLSRTYTEVFPVEDGGCAVDNNSKSLINWSSSGSFADLDHNGKLIKLKILSISEDPNIYISELMTPETNMYALMRAPNEFGGITFYNFDYRHLWLLPQDLKNMVDTSKDQYVIKLKEETSVAQFLRGIARLKIEYDPEINRVACKPLGHPFKVLPPAPSQEVQADATPNAHRVALLIGNSSYQFVPYLPNPRNDASSVGITLQGLGFQIVQLAPDLNHEQFVHALRSFREEADKADWALVYYAGHGIEVNGRNYLIPVDAHLATDRDIEDETVSLDRVLDAISGAKSIKIVILDACRNNPFLSTMQRKIASRSIDRGLARVEPDASTLVVYSAKDGETAEDGVSGHSPFSAALIRRLDQPHVEVRRLFDLVTGDVLQATSNQQRPFTYGSIPGEAEFYFRN